MAIDYSDRDKAGQVAFYVLLWKKNGISLDLFDDYWKDVHGPVCARLPGQDRYWQFHVAHNDGGHWSLPDDYVNASSDSEQFDGIAELTFKSEADRQTWFQAAGLLMDDEGNLFSKAIGYNTSPGNSITYVDKIYDGSPIGTTEVQKYHCPIRKAAGVSTEEFRAYLTDKLAPIFTNYDRILKFRLHLFEQVDSSRPDAGAVSHTELPEQQYDAAIEVAFANNLDLALFLDSEAYRSALKDFPKYIKHFKPFPERSAYTFVYDGKITLAGQRSVAVADLINRIGAVNQIKDNIVSLMTGGSSSNKTPIIEKLPGTNADLVKTLFSRGEAFDSQGFIELFTETPVYQFGNWDICFDKASIKQSTDAFFGMVSALYHEIKMLWEIGEVVFVEMDVIYWRKDGSSVSLPCMDIFRFEGDKVAELRICMDANPVGDASVPVADTAAVAIAANRQRVPSPEIMRKFFAEHPEGRRRVKAGFIPKWAIAGPKWSIDGVFGNNVLGTPVRSSEKLPGTNADLVKTLFSRGEAFDSQGFIDLFTETPVYQFGNWDICFDKASIKKSTDAFFGMVSALYHEIKMLWEIDEAVFVEMDVIYWRKDGSSVSLPCMDIFRFEGNKVAELRIFMDAGPVGNASIPVADTAAVAIAAQKQRVPSPEIMRKFFAEHPEGRRRVNTGFIPKWAIAGPKWSIDESPTITTEAIADERWSLLKTYLKDLKVEELLSLLGTEKLNNSDREYRILERL
jgi:ketosteroid isomerase-like protein